MFANLSTNINCEIINCFSTLNNFLAYALGPLKTYLLANLQEAQGSFSISRVIERPQKAFEELKDILKVIISDDDILSNIRK